ncbi:hypothetical protein HS088_TW05G00046 [Tripterygium wilfordii]|uniref:Uncharacterized protein n=1 Tax=Tripterygium wilfordii TaxID=458696 RepID=A0A7J7DLT7_TRIWF|nr:uncharacterized protein At4g38062-like [Tripterygium wilfordii]KAF5747325.1 hypothetical protein HS088_TW05G00046 [Tripterygium wilfordii]
MDKVCEELDEDKAEIENLMADLKRKLELSKNLKNMQNEQLIKIKEVSLKIEKQNDELNEKAEEISELKQINNDLKCRLNERESITKHLNAANDNLRAEYEEKYRKWKEENKGLLLALDEANEKNIDLEQKIHVCMTEIEGLKRVLSVSEKKCLEAEKKAKASEELRARDDALVKLEEENQKLEDQLKWKKEQFQHLEDAHEKLRDQFMTSKKEWERERRKLVEEISSLQSSLDSQTRISEDLQSQLKMCHQALAHEESGRKYLEIELSEFKTRFESVLTEYQDAKSQLEFLTAQRDKEIAALRYSLDTKETFHKEMEYRAGKLEQEKLELLESLRELQEAGIHEVGNSSSVGKLRNRFKNLEQMHGGCSANLRAKEAEWRSQLDKAYAELNDCRSELESKDATIKELIKDLERCNSSIMQLKLQNEEILVMLLVFKSGISEAQLNFQTVETEIKIRDREEEKNASILMKELEMKNLCLSKALANIEEEREKAADLLKRVECLDLVEEQQLLMQKELERYKDMLEESSKCQFLLKEQYVQAEIGLKEKLQGACESLDVANSELIEEREKVAALSERIESLFIIEDERDLLHKELEKCREKLEESSRSQVLLEEKILLMDSNFKEKLGEVTETLDTATSQLAEERKKTACLLTRIKSLEEHVLQIESDSKMKLIEVSDALNVANSELTEEYGKTSSLLRRVESLEFIEDQLCLMQKELESYREMLEESSRYKLQLEEQVLQIKSDSNKKLGEVNDALDRANCELDERLCAAHEIEFERWIWKSIAQRLKDDLEDNQELWKELEASLLAQIVDGETAKKEKEGLIHMLEDDDIEIENLNPQIVLLEQKIEIEGLEDNGSTPVMKTLSLVSEKENFLQKMREKDKIVEAFQKEIGWLEQESLRREFEGLVFAQITAERIFEDEIEKYILLVEGKHKKLDDLLQLVKSLEQKFNKRLISFSSQLAEKQMEIDMVHEAWEKITATKILAQLEIEEKRLMIIVELKDDICHIQQKLVLQENLLSHSKQQALQIEAEVEEKETEIINLANHMESKLRASDALINELRDEKQKLHEVVMELLSERENLLCFIEGLGDRISNLSIEDVKLMGMLGRISESLDKNGSDVISQGDYRPFDIYHIQQKLELQENLLSHAKQQALQIEAEVAEKETEIKNLANQMESKLRASDALINELRDEKQKLHEDVMELLSERENLFLFIEGLGDRISKLSIEDVKLMGMLGRMSESMNKNGSDVVSQDDYRLFDIVKEDATSHPSSPLKKFEVIPEGRTPLRELNYNCNR